MQLKTYSPFSKHLQKTKYYSLTINFWIKKFLMYHGTTVYAVVAAITAIG